ncbi:hypothetical protein FA13DRAFT_1671609, partial [Coprinellus micaceus]
MSDLPRETREQFNKIFIPHLVEWIGQQYPWHQQTDEEVLAVWSRALPEVEPNERVRLAIAKLVSDKIGLWRNKFAQQALEVLVNFWPHLPENSTSSRKAWVEWASQKYGKKDNIFKFCYREFEDAEYEDDESGQPVIGVFQSKLIASTLGTHLAAISSIPPQARSGEFPWAALVLSI